ncbi:hypothetical protein HYU90_03360 [Candidatus Collierbacteria bacterium]|nr:hypothetical protein [Candidatus Collierbacteria bacterium]
MKKNGGELSLVDHRSLYLDLGLGGTTICFESRVRMDDGRISTYVIDEHNQRWTKVEQLSGRAGLFEVTNHHGGIVDYDTRGNLQRLRLPVVEFFGSLDYEDRQNLLPEFLFAMDSMSAVGAEITVDVDLREGLSDGSGTGWVYLVCDDSTKQVNQGKLMGFEVGPKVAMRSIYGIGLVDLNKNVMGVLGVQAQVSDGMLFVAVGDGRKMALTGRRLKVDPALIEDIGTPAGTLYLLSTLRAIV